MDRALIVNASPIICLAKANLVDLLFAVSNDVLDSAYAKKSLATFLQLDKPARTVDGR